MAAGADLEAREARHGEKMIEVRIRFFTDGIASGADQIIPKHASASGTVRLQPNNAHNITSGKPEMFNSMADIPRAIERILLQHGIKLHPSSRMQRYIVPTKSG